MKTDFKICVLADSYQSEFFIFQATAIKIHPLYVMLPCTISASLAFMLPVATPPNAIAFSYGNLRVMDMVRLFRKDRKPENVCVDIHALFWITAHIQFLDKQLILIPVSDHYYVFVY